MTLWACQSNQFKQLNKKIDFDNALYQEYLTQMVNKVSDEAEITSYIKNSLSAEEYSFIINAQDSLQNVDSLISLIEGSQRQGFGIYFSQRLAPLKTFREELSFDNELKAEPFYDSLASLEYGLRTLQLDYLKALHFGLVDPKTIFSKNHFDYNIEQPDSLWYRALLQTANSNSAHYHTNNNPYYSDLQRQYDTLLNNKKEGLDLPPLPAKNIEVGDEYAGVPLLNQKFKIQTVDSLELIFSKPLSDSIKQFQQDHGLAADGVLGQQSFDVLNQGTGSKLRQIEVTLERMRWQLPVDFDNALIVNIPHYDLTVTEKGKVVQTHKVAVGKKGPQFQTPEFYRRLQSIVVNPKWTVPYSIAVNEILPYCQMDGSYLEYLQYEIYLNGKKMNPYKIDFNQYSKTNFPFQIVQKSGSFNALGTIKFLFPNQFNVYLHDTPSFYVFRHYNRAFSHGCVRVDEPDQLGNYLMANNAAFIQARKGTATQSFTPKKPKSVCLVYYTARLSPAGKLIIRQDIYGRDQLLRQKLDDMGVGIH